MIENFTYSNAQSAGASKSSFNAVVPAGLNDAKQLLQALYERLNLPEYFGFNWNALEECLRDFHWIKEQSVFLVHEELPSLTEPICLSTLGF